MDYPLEHARPGDPVGVACPRRTPARSSSKKQPVVDEFGQWAHADWPRKIKSREQLEKELAEEEKSLAGGGEFELLRQYGGYKNTKAKATGFFRVEQIDGRWWFVDPDGHLFLSTGSNCIERRAERPEKRGACPRPAADDRLGHEHDRQLVLAAAVRGRRSERPMW